jgi:hypothetical protein
MLAQLDIIPGGKSTLSRNSLTLIMAKMEAGGCSFEGVAEQSKRALETKLAHILVLMMGEVERSRHTLVPMVLSRNVLDLLPALVVSARVATKAFVLETERMDPRMQANFAEAGVREFVLQQDANFPWGNTGSSYGAVALFHIFNQHGEAVGGMGITSKRQCEVEYMYERIKDAKECSPHGVPLKLLYSDEPSVVSATVKKVFGELVQVLKDLFHLLQELGKLVSQKHKLHATLMRALSLCFFTHFHQDMELLRKTLIESGKTLDEVEALLNDPAFIKGSNVRRDVREGNIIADAVIDTFAQFRKHAQAKGLFVGGAEYMDKVYTICDSIRLYANVEDDGSIPVWLNVGTAENPVWLTLRGTGMVENYHRYNKSLRLYMYSARVANALYVWSLTVHSHIQRVRRLRRRLLVGSLMFYRLTYPQ